MGDTVRFGLIGAGCIGQMRAQALKKVDHCQLAAVVDVDKGLARAAAPSRDTYVLDDYQRMLALDEVDAVIVSTPPQPENLKSHPR